MRILHSALDLGREPTVTRPPALHAVPVGPIVRTLCRLLVVAGVSLASARLAAVHWHEATAAHHEVTASSVQQDQPVMPVAVAAAVLLLAAIHPLVRSLAVAPDAGLRLRAGINGLTWGVLVMLAVQFTGEAFAPFPGGHDVVALVLGTAMAVATARTHRHSIGHETYRTFNLMAMLLAAGSIASMSLTPTGEWWSHNFSTLGTSDDVAAACFNAAVVLSGGGIAVMSASLTRSLVLPRFGVRRGGLIAMRALVVAIGVGLMGVGLVPIDGDTVLHDAFASSAGAAFGALVIGARWFGRRMPRTLVVVSDVFLVVLLAAWAAYALLSVVNLTVFEVVAFSLVFVWLITLLVTTSPAGEGESAPVEASRATTVSRGRLVAASARSFALSAPTRGIPALAGRSP